MFPVADDVAGKISVLVAVEPLVLAVVVFVLFDGKMRPISCACDTVNVLVFVPLGPAAPIFAGPPAEENIIFCVVFPLFNTNRGLFVAGTDDTTFLFFN